MDREQRLMSVYTPHFVKEIVRLSAGFLKEDDPLVVKAATRMANEMVVLFNKK